MDSNEHCTPLMEKNLKKFEVDPSAGLCFANPTQFRETCLSQQFSFGMSRIEYILENPSSPEVYQKLIQTCKYFFLKNPILVINNLSYCDEWKYCNATECYCCECKYEHKRIDIDNLNCRFWISKELRANSTNSMLVSNFLPKIYEFGIKEWDLYYQELTFNELKFLSRGAKHCELNYCHVKYDDNGEFVLLEEIIKLFSGAEKFKIVFSDESKNAICESYEKLADACGKIRRIDLSFVPAVFDICDFYQRLKSSKNRALISIYFDDHIHSPVETIEEILATENCEFVPLFFSSEMSDESLSRSLEFNFGNQQNKAVFKTVTKVPLQKKSTPKIFTVYGLAAKYC